MAVRGGLILGLLQPTGRLPRTRKLHTRLQPIFLAILLAPAIQEQDAVFLALELPHDRFHDPMGGPLLGLLVLPFVVILQLVVWKLARTDEGVIILGGFGVGQEIAKSGFAHFFRVSLVFRRPIENRSRRMLCIGFH